VASLGIIADGIEVLLTDWVDVAEFIALLRNETAFSSPDYKAILGLAAWFTDARQFMCTIAL
jgi:hypothetical protein